MYAPGAVVQDPRRGNRGTARTDHLLVNDERRWRTVLFGSCCGYITGCSYADTMAWDDSNWISLAPDLSPLAPWATAHSYSPMEHCVVLCGGFGRFGVTDSTLYDYLVILRHDTRPPSPRERCASGGDEDGDLLVDCEDPDCEGLPCATSRCVSGSRLLLPRHTRR